MMNIKKILGYIFSLAIAITVFACTPLIANANGYTYTVKIVLGGSGDEGAYFNDELGLSVPKTAKVEMIDNDRCIKITNLAYDDEVTIDPTTMVKIAPFFKEDDEGNQVQYNKYYVKGVRMSGMDDVLAKNSFKVSYDETFVVAYGVGDVVPYIVKYVDNNGQELEKPLTGYAPAHEELYVAYRNIPGYKPNTYNYHTYSLQAPSYNESKGEDEPYVFTFYYSKAGTATVVEDTVEVVETSSVTGDAEYSYQAISRSTEHRQGTVRTATGNAITNDDEGVDEVEEETSDATITDGDTPTDVIDIDEEDPARAGGTREKLLRNMIIGIIIAIIAIISILVTLYVAERKRKREIVKVQNNKKNNE